MDTKRTNSYEIFSGPSRSRLFDACKYAYGEGAYVTVKFGVVIGYTMPPGHPGCAYVPMMINDIVITGIEHEDHAGNSFNIHGYCAAIFDVGGGDRKITTLRRFTTPRHFPEPSRSANKSQVTVVLTARASARVFSISKLVQITKRESRDVICHGLKIVFSQMDPPTGQPVRWR